MDRDDLLDRYRSTRDLSVDLCRPLRAEDYRIQSMPDVSPPWWNLGHTSWFFAKNVLPNVRATSEVLGREDTSPIDIPLEAFATV